MRAILLEAIVILAIVSTVPSQTAAAPVSGSVIGHAATMTSPVTKVPCAFRRVCGPRGCVSRRACW